MNAAASLAGALMLAQAGVEQLGAPTTPASSATASQARADQVHVDSDDPTHVAQLPPDARAVQQPLPRAALSQPPAAQDVARSYVTIFGTGDNAAGVAAGRELGVETIAQLATEARLAPGNKPAADQDRIPTTAPAIQAKPQP